MVVNNVVGTCYEDAWRFLIKEEEGELIHGSVQLTEGGARIKHAWVELPTGYIWEPQTGQYFTRKDFGVLSSIEEHRYTVEEAAIMLARVGKYGPWTEQERQILKRGNPNLEPWQMTKEKFVEIYLERFKSMLSKEAFSRVTKEELQKEREEAIDYQKHTIRQALVAGRPVPPEVLRDYPELVTAQYKAEYESLYRSVAELPEFRGKAWRAESGYSHAPGTTVADIIRFEREELGNEYPDISDELLKELDRYSAEDAMWVNRRRKDCLFYLSEGESEEAVGRIHLPEDTKIVSPDYCGGYLVLRGSATPTLKKGGNPDTGTSIIDLRGDYDEIAHVKDGILYRKGNIVQVWWDIWGKETWTGPSEEQAREDFNAMKERWSSSKLKGDNPIPEELDLARTLAIIDSRPKGRIIESKLREEFGDAVIDALRQGRYVVSGSAGYNPPLLVSLKGRELIQGGNPMAAPKTESERLSFHERIFGKGATPPLERLGRGQTLNELLPMAPDQGPPLPRAMKIRWPWSKP